MQQSTRGETAKALTHVGYDTVKAHARARLVPIRHHVSIVEHCVL